MSSKRIDVLISGYDKNATGQIVIVELKQWSELSSVEGMDGIVQTRMQGRNVHTAHPSYQAWSYAQLMYDFSAVVQDEQMYIWPCAYLHNYTRTENDPLDAVQYRDYENLAPAFTKKDVRILQAFICKYIHKGDQAKLLYTIENGEVRPSKSLQNSLCRMLKGNSEFVLIDEQKEIYETLLYMARQAKQMRRKHVLVVKGGPGTGKSVLAINALVQLTKDGQVVQYVSKNSAPRNVFSKKLQGSYRATYINNLFKGSGCYYECMNGQFDTLLVDEAHRLAEKSGMFKNKGENQTKEIIHASSCAVFFIDEHQRVTTDDMGSVELIKKFADQVGAIYRECKLTSQFRCNGSDGYLSWLDGVLYGEDTAVSSLDGVDYEFRVVDSPSELQREIRNRNTNGVNARIVAGYCWDWNAAGRNDSNVHDIKIDSFAISWNLNGTTTWAIDSDSVDQAGCIHTCQGLEFEHVGVIIGPDMTFVDGKIVTDFTKRAHTDQSVKGLRGKLRSDPQKAYALGDEIVRNTYRTLMTRGSKSCLVYCCDKKLAEYLKRLASGKESGLTETESNSLDKRNHVIHEFIDEELKYVDWLPYYDMRAACGYFGDGEPVGEGGWVKVSGLGRLNRNMFVVRASGRSMEPMIHDGDLCVFKLNPVGSRQGKVLLVQHRSVFDVDNGGAYSIKKYSSRKKFDGNGNWEHEKIVLMPLNHDYAEIEIDGNDENEFQVVGELLKVLPME